MRTTYHVTGVDRTGKRFRIVTLSQIHAYGINVWQGSVWIVRDGTRKLLHRVYN